MLTGREKEILILQEALQSHESEMVSVIGRRRVGKTYLVQTVYKNKIDFEITGIQDASRKEQLEHFSIALNLYTDSPLPIQQPKTWLEAFRHLIIYLKSIRKKKKRIVFFDEMPWLAGRRSGFLKAFGFFWNSWAVKNDVVVVICGSAASWMIRNVVNNKGGLYNRITKRIHLYPFSLDETEQYLRSKLLNFTRYQIVQFYMALGGIPHYLKEIRKGESVAQNIDRICFERSGPLRNEFKNLYPSLFEQSENHIAIVKALSEKWSGLTRKMILKRTGISNGGGATKTLDELLHSGFITEFIPFGHKKKETSYRLTDEYSLFYLKFIEPLRKQEGGVWINFQQTPTYRSWAGYTFENICFKHLPQIRNALGISGVYATSSSFYHKGADGMEGCQIDLLIDRNDQVINLCEIKFSHSEFILTKTYAVQLRNKMALFQHYSKTKKQIALTFISPYGLKPNKHTSGLVDREITLDHLFD